MGNHHLVLFCNIKGGVGKSCLCTLFAHYLKRKGINVAVVDADIQRTIIRMRERDLEKEPGITPPFEVLSVFANNPSGDVTKIMPALKDFDGWVLVDCPGNMETDRLMPLFENADFVVTPLTYEETDVDATLNGFVETFKKLNDKASIIFIPNRINERSQIGIEELREERKKARERLLTYGKVTARIKESVVLQPHRYNTVKDLDKFQEKAVEYPFNDILEAVGIN